MANNVGDGYIQPINPNPQGYYAAPGVPQMIGGQRINNVQQAGNSYQTMQSSNQILQTSPRIIDFVQGDLAASIYPINFYPQEVYLLDLDQRMIYNRNRDNTGKLSPLQKFKMDPVEDEEKEKIDTSKFVKEDEILDLISEVVQEQLEKKLSDMFNKKGGKES